MSTRGWYLSGTLCPSKKVMVVFPPCSVVLEFHTVSLSPSGAAKAGRGTRTKALHDYLDNFEEGGGVCGGKKFMKIDGVTAQQI